MTYTVGDAYHTTTTFEMYISPLEAQNGFFNADMRRKTLRMLDEVDQLAAWPVEIDSE